MNSRAPDGETCDRLLGGRVILRQPQTGYRAAIDPVLLAACVDPRAGSRVLDLGCGVGAVSFCLLARVPGLAVTGLDVDDRAVALARRNALENGVGDRFTAITGDVADPGRAIASGDFDVVVTNPPYGACFGTGTPPEAAHRTARIETTATLDVWIDASASALRPRGTLALIHRADRIDHVLATVSRSFGDILVYPFWPHAGAPARRILVMARKGTRGPSRLAAGMVLHEADGRFTEAADAVLRGGGLHAKDPG